METRPVQARATAASRGSRICGITTIVILLFWIGQFSILTVSRMLYGAGDDESFLLPRVLVTLAGIALSFVIAVLHQRSWGQTLIRRLMLAITLAVIGAVMHAVANYTVFRVLLPMEHIKGLNVPGYAMAALQWFWSYAALSGLLLAITYSYELSENERRTAQLQREAHAAHLRALRYQLNPHFMFNTLNSIASLVSTHEVGLAERMVENLADFLRAGLALDPTEDIPLGEEIELQSLYLAIEAVRFPNRLVVEIDVPDEVRSVRVPSLIIQPLVENAVRHAVTLSIVPVTLVVSAKRIGERLHIEVRNTAGSGKQRSSLGGGTGVGIANVAERLAARYGDDCGFSSGPEPDGGFAVRFAIPIEAAA